MSKVFFGGDHAGVGLKSALCEAVRGWGYEVEDLGTHDASSVDYPDFAHAVAEAVLANEGTLGVLVCGTGLGVSIAANRHAGIRAAVCHDTFSARMTRAHNDANIVCLGARVVGGGLAEDVVKTFLEGTFEAGRHTRRVGKIELP